MYLLAQARQFPGMTWYLPKAPVRSLSASNRPPSVQARPVMNASRCHARPRASADSMPAPTAHSETTMSVANAMNALCTTP